MAISALFIVELFTGLMINCLNCFYTVGQADDTIDIILENDGEIPSDWQKCSGKGCSKKDSAKPFNSEMRYTTRYFAANIDSDGNIITLDTSHITSVTRDRAEEYAKEIASEDKARGFVGGLFYRYGEKDLGGGKSLIVMYDYSRQAAWNISILIISGIIAVLLLIVFSLFICAFSKRAVRPIVRSIEKQTHFITDAGHELKTPLAIIKADAEVLEMTGEGNEWTESILNQTDRLSGLLSEMLTLAKAQEIQRRQFTPVDLSGLAKKAAKDINPLCTANSKPLKEEIEENIVCMGDEKMLENIMSILLENAVKYGSRDREISFGLKRYGRHAKLWVENYCDDMPQCDTRLLFERFYRADSSRTRDTGGSGIGLSTAKTITDAHGGKINCVIDGDRIIFTVKLKRETREEA